MSDGKDYSPPASGDDLPDPLQQPICEILMSIHSQNQPFAKDRLISVLGQLPTFEEALARLLFVVEYRRPCGLVIGAAGTGKSLLLEAVFRELSESENSDASCCPILIDSQRNGAGDLCWRIAAGIGLSPEESTPSELVWRMIEDRFEGAALSGHFLIPILDHVNDPNEQTLAGLRRCCHLGERFGSTVLLSAPPPIGTAMADIVGPLCDLRIEMPLWTLQETSRFLGLIMDAPGLPVLAADAAKTVQIYAGGRLRETVQLMRLALFAAQAQNLDVIDTDLLDTVAAEIWQPATVSRMPTGPLPSSVELASIIN